MKKTLISIALVAAAAPAAFALTEVANFSWASQSVPTVLAQAQIGVTVPGFSGAGTLTGITINVNGNTVVGTSTAQNQGTVASTLTLTLSGSHQVSINGLMVNSAPIFGTSSAPGVIPGGVVNLGPISGNIAGTASTGSTAGWTGGNIPVLIAFAGAAGVSGSPQVQILATPTVVSSGVGTVTYTYDVRNPLVPEAETYVAGLALAGLVGYGFYRRSRKA